MRQVVGKTTRDLDAIGLARLRADRRDLVLDLGTGDGKHVLVVARARPDALVIGLDAAPDAMRKTASRAAAKPAKGGTPNALFVWASAQKLPAELADVSEVHCLMPWGSLLRGLITPDEDLLRAVAAACRPRAPFLITLNLHAWRPPVVDVGETPEPTPESALETLAPAYAAAGWTIATADYLDDASIAELGTSWTKRLGSTRDALAVLGLRGRIG
ncbi:MAG: class I SAM-dependent methyltransferase [Jatrophihabitans sp.]